MTAALLSLSACTYEARLPATYFAETSQALAPGRVAITGVAGAGTTAYGVGQGGGGRVRVGVGGDQEIRIEGAVVDLDAPTDGCVIDCPKADAGRYTALGWSAAASWKLQRRDFAWIVSLGADHHRIRGEGMPADTDRGNSLDATVGGVKSGRGPLYFGVRGVLGVPLDATAPPLIGFSAAVGAMVQLDPRLHVSVEAGPRVTLPCDAGILASGAQTLGVQAVLGVGVDL
jgi:hypothetical protein